ncbi:hypothetical protein BHM03_00059764 [Ensete ventricosum]|nr:hypothetical protein BHM03_00059764 [Ensete ventricosum]
MLYPGVTQEWEGEGELSMEQTQSEVVGPYDLLAEAIHGGIVHMVKRGEEAMTSPEGLSYPKAKRQSERRCKATDSRVMGLAAPWYRKGETFVESLIPCSHGRRALVMKEANELENAEANSKYLNKAKGQRPENLKPVLMGLSSR